jgi:hypothetical protein
MADGGVRASVPLDESDASAEDLEQRIKREQHAQSQKLRGRYSFWILAVLVFQTLAITAFFAIDGFGGIPDTHPYIGFHVSDDLFKVYAVSVFASIVALGFIITKNLFPADGPGFWGSVLNLVMGRHDQV